MKKRKKQADKKDLEQGERKKRAEKKKFVEVLLSLFKVWLDIFTSTTQYFSYPKKNSLDSWTLSTYYQIYITTLKTSLVSRT